MSEFSLRKADREEKREKFRQEGIRAWNAYRETGLHASLAEVDAWLTKLQADRDTKPPECHV